MWLTSKSCHTVSFSHGSITGLPPVTHEPGEFLRIPTVGEASAGRQNTCMQLRQVQALHHYSH